MRHLHNILGIFLVVIIIEYLRRFIQKKTINKIEKTIENYDNKKKFKSTDST